MNTPPSPQAAIFASTDIEAVRTVYFLASFNLFFVLAAAGFLYFGVASGSGAELAQYQDSVVIPIRILCVVGAVTATCAWLVSWVRLHGRAEHEADRRTEDVRS
jgi:hypothetical protein